MEREQETHYLSLSLPQYTQPQEAFVQPLGSSWSGRKNTDLRYQFKMSLLAVKAF